jgi:hypothetical protein
VDKGDALMCPAPCRGQARRMSRYLRQHCHTADERGVALDSFKGHESPIRHHVTLASSRLANVTAAADWDGCSDLSMDATPHVMHRQPAYRTTGERRTA